MVRTLFCVVTLGLAAAVGVAPAADEKGIDEDGYLKTWLLLAPFPFGDSDEAGKVLDAEQVKDEAKIAPKEGDKVKAGEKELTWKKHQAKEHYFDINAHLEGVTERSTGYAVCYIVSDVERAGLTMKLGSDDLCKVYLNGKEIHKATEERPLEKDQDSVPDITLKKGTNVLVVKVVNTIMDWSGCVRFLDKDGKPLNKLTVQLTK